MDAVEYLKQRTRMNHNCDIGMCQTCELGSNYNGRTVGCETFESEYPEEAVKVIESWAKEHPVRTYKRVFLEKFPNAALSCDDAPFACLWHVFGLEHCPEWCERDGATCADCWNREWHNE